MLGVQTAARLGERYVAEGQLGVTPARLRDWPLRRRRELIEHLSKDALALPELRHRAVAPPTSVGEIAGSRGVRRLRDWQG